jgi:hypothetical protein
MEYIVDPLWDLCHDEGADILGELHPHKRPPDCFECGCIMDVPVDN